MTRIQFAINKQGGKPIKAKGLIFEMEKLNMADVKVVTSMTTTVVKVECPHCNETQDGFVSNPAGEEVECDDCGKKYKVHPEADIEFR
jgi:ribosomal protein S27E